ncbi:MAG: hypothetical protein ACK4N5_26370 [Myxococcales bacterium]
MSLLLATPRKLCASAFAAMLALYACLVVVHGAEHRHRYCAEHEAFEEVGGDSARADAAGQPGEQDERDGEDHELCPLIDTGERNGPPQLASLVPVGLLTHAPAVAAKAGPLTPPLPPLAVAPKSSPPVHG